MILRALKFKPKTFQFRSRRSQSSIPLQCRINHVDAKIIKTGFNIDAYRSNRLIESLIRNGRIGLAQKVFDEMPRKDTFAANYMISGYAKSGLLVDARHLFDKTTEKNVVTWTIMIGAYAQYGSSNEAFQLFRTMLESGIKPDHVSVVALLNSCDSSDFVNSVGQIHASILKLGFDGILTVDNTLLDSYCKCGVFEQGRRIFYEMDVQDSITYNIMVTGYSKEGFYYEAVELFMVMRDLGFQPSQFTFFGVLMAATGLGNAYIGRQIHSLMMKLNYGWNIYLNNSLLDFYSKCGSLDEAEVLFDEMTEKNIVSYNVMISGYAWKGQHDEFFKLFKEMHYNGFDRTCYPFPSLLSVAGALQDQKMGKQLHAQLVVIEAIDGVHVKNALIDMYSKCGLLEAAEVIFRNTSLRNIISWTAMIAGYVQNNYHEAALEIFGEMRRAGLNPDTATLSCILRASANLASLSLGKELHSYITRYGYMFNVFCGSALLDMYAKCGCLDEAQKIFDEMPNRNVVSWNALICAYGQNGHGKKAIRLFEDMLYLGFELDNVTVLNVLSACSHNGLVEEGLRYFDLMRDVYGIKLGKGHYSCVIDLLGRVGRLEEVEKLVNDMPFEADQIIWNSILNSSKKYDDQELAKRAADKLFGMELKDAAPFVIMSNVFAKAGQWNNAANVKKMMRDRGIRKEPAYSWVEIKQRIYTFSSDDNKNPQNDEIRALLQKLSDKMEKEGYRPDTDCALHLVDDDSKVESLRYHSERLAIAFALLNTTSGTTIRVMKNLRTCTDCHAAIKVMSKIVGREIIVRDSSRFHHFNDGSCSCGDYW